MDPLQSVLVRQPTQRPLDVSQILPLGSAAQSVLDLQAATHQNPLPGQVSPVGQSAFVVQPHVPKQVLPRGELAQSAFDWQPVLESVVASMPASLGGVDVEMEPPHAKSVNSETTGNDHRARDAIALCSPLSSRVTSMAPAACAVNLHGGT